MPIKVTHEPIDELNKWGTGLAGIREVCIFCSEQTRYWHTPTNQPVCPKCAETHTVKNIREHILSQPLRPRIVRMS